VTAPRARFLPLLLSIDDPEYDEQHVLDEYFGDLFVAYAVGPPFGERLVTWDDMDRVELSRRDLRRQATQTLDSLVDTVRIHGQPPALMISFGGLESSLLLADPFWESMAESVPGELVVGVPARDVVIVTGSRSQAGLAKARRAVDRIFLAKGPHLLLEELLVWQDGGWEFY